MATTASLFAGIGTLTEIGDAVDNSIVTSRDAIGNILVNCGAVTVLGHHPTVANTSLIQVLGQNGNDIISLEDVRPIVRRT
jgi:hypothetical protein